ncbi:2-amino-4-hydroxy-6-hydroxymethyldihydropteridine diphosphokinase [Mycobacterium haemophilum]|uniref:2-amino-4-hydroxy-6-hydroxymethyldihydropteridine diphosphokinase n=1 Tax=Mycobacterium haemophilum TaxID=29311 RepID=A0A0I9TY56_9MYCO|nr:2-amino-4-hydroxy-6-hydroxymethyldihydropteridine diphosphokinase [Mycobacterium haemophilum]AKN15949.1 2-amino-4-hydroxy-6-hydroxymethyldihydropteridine pyrophosphokinase [Mycobacterium haemophilum DSM 44634]KLO26542.1 2-amino-4-hydroxy-6-hydroxymethyldihydropteridine pyrophosphokinase [Mycobacterium haemophilum]KLO34716.1 2-amino-4-hydroxy-6-hydroxymethyldihydropteridine pyrophosphokinase [Mycobacterium haemophilum]KLO40399.1 2-amino-4-hydroxy-6-hydroxymethyldihydropteridine pyrophosphokin
MTRVVLSIGSNLGDRLARLQSVVDGLGQAVVAVSPVYDTVAWGGVEQGSFLNAVVIADGPAYDAQAWLCRAQQLERKAGRVRGQRWGPRTLDVDVISCYQTSGATNGAAEVITRESDLTLPHPRAHLRAFVLVPWLAVDPDAELTVAGRARRVDQLLAEVEPTEREGVRLTKLTLKPKSD